MNVWNEWVARIWLENGGENPSSMRATGSEEQL
jgi:hypothetical protein